jgi:DNA helicase II / ATP-dependent DNA helicase PcrA
MTIIPTTEQSAVIDAAITSPSSLMIRAYAGSSKTTTLSLASWARYDAGQREPTLYIVFNKRNKEEAEGKDTYGRPRFPPNVVIRTLNGLGHAAFSRALGRRLVLDDRKLGKIITAIARRASVRLDTEEWSGVRELVSAAQRAGLVPHEFQHGQSFVKDVDETWEGLTELMPTSEAIALAGATLVESIKQSLTGTISFDDQIYMSVCFSGAFTRFPLVLVDEAQDYTVMNIEMLRRSAAGRIIAVGDEKQGVYLWRGAAAGAMERIRALRTDWLDFALTKSFRCPKAIVARQQSHAPRFTAAEANAEGTFVRLGGSAGIEATPICWSWPHVAKYTNGSSCAILCRNNAPLLSLAFKLLRSSVPCSMIGRDISNGLQALLRKLVPDEALRAAAVAAEIAAWRDREEALAIANDMPLKAESIRDRADGLLAILEGSKARTAQELSQALTKLFDRGDSRVVLSSIHRAKGLEWDTVLHLDPWRIPSRYAKGPALAQELNLRYVCETRAKRTLIEANLEDFAA